MTIQVFNSLSDEKKLELLPMEWIGQGNGYKREIDFSTVDGDEIIYIPESGYDNLIPTHVYTKEDIIEICDGNHAIAEDIFNMVDWQFPETLYSEFKDSYEI